MKKRIHFTARHPKTLTTLDLYYYSMAQAKKFNPALVEWKNLGETND